MVLNSGKSDFIDRIEFGLALASRRFMEQRAAENGTVIISDDGVVKRVPAKEILEWQLNDAAMNQLLKEGSAKYLNKQI